jgi:hypothetical protein
MKKIVLLVFAAVLCAFSGKNKMNSLAEDHLKGRVRSILYRDYHIRKGVRGAEYKTVGYYDEHGNDVKDVIPSPTRSGMDSSNMEFIQGFKYNDLGQTVEKVIYNADGSISWDIKFLYDSAGVLSERKRYKSDGYMMEKEVCKFNADNDPISITSYGPEDTLHCIMRYHYDDDGKLFAVTEDCSALRCLGDPGYSRIDSTRFDKNEHVIGQVSLNSRGEIVERYDNYITATDAKGNVTEFTRIHSEKYGGIWQSDTTYHKCEITYYPD